MQMRFRAELWESPGTWWFLTVPDEESADIRERPRPPHGFGSVRVTARVGGSRWATSVFPDAKLGRYVLPVKKAVRDAEGIGEGDLVEVELELLEP